jgi:hypothetical protein
MTYIPVDPDKVDFTLSGSYFIPDCDIVNFSFGVDGELEIRTSNLEFRVEMESCRWFAGSMIISSGMEININMSTSKVDVLTLIKTESAEIFILVEPMVIEVCADMIPENMEIVPYMFDGTIRSTEAHHLPSGRSSAGLRMGWEKPTNLETVIDFPYGNGEVIDQLISDISPGASHIDADFDSQWVTLFNYDNYIVLPSNGFIEYSDISSISDC